MKDESPKINVIIVGSGDVGKMAIERLHLEAAGLNPVLVSEVDFNRETITENDVVFLASELVNPILSKAAELAFELTGKTETIKPFYPHGGSKFHK